MRLLCSFYNVFLIVETLKMRLHLKPRVKTPTYCTSLCYVLMSVKWSHIHAFSAKMCEREGVHLFSVRLVFVRWPCCIPSILLACLVGLRSLVSRESSSTQPVSSSVPVFCFEDIREMLEYQHDESRVNNQLWPYPRIFGDQCSPYSFAMHS